MAENNQLSRTARINRRAMSTLNRTDWLTAKDLEGKLPGEHSTVWARALSHCYQADFRRIERKRIRRANGPPFALWAYRIREVPLPLGASMPEEEMGYTKKKNREGLAELGYRKKKGAGDVREDLADVLSDISPAERPTYPQSANKAPLGKRILAISEELAQIAQELEKGECAPNREEALGKAILSMLNGALRG